MSYRVNGKNLALGRLIPRGKNADKRMRYLHVSPRGTAVFTPIATARVTLPEYESPSTLAAIIPQKELPYVPSGKSDVVELPEGKPAVTQPEYLVPQVDKCFPGPEYQSAAFTCNGEVLRQLLTIACEVSNDSQKMLRLRICDDINAIRIDTYTQPGDQEFCGVLKGIDYDGDYIPGEPTSDTKKVEKVPVQRPLLLHVNRGRRFRGSGE